MKKRILSFAIAICLIIPCLFALGGCNFFNSTTDAAVGKYSVEAVRTTQEGQEYTLTNARYQQLKTANFEGGEEGEAELYQLMRWCFETNFTFELKEDKTCVANGSNGTWTRNGEKLVMIISTDYEEQTLEATFRNNKIYTTMGETTNDTTLIFTKKK